MIHDCEWRDHFGHRCTGKIRPVLICPKTTRESLHYLCEDAIKQVKHRGYKVKNFKEGEADARD